MWSLLWLLSSCTGIDTARPPESSKPAPSALEQRLQASLDALGPNYVPRTKHLLEDGRPRFVNRLIEEPSPYLRQHAHNPVDWYPWGSEALERAKTLDRPVLLSVGYATCHWCHVMEEESFEDLEIAAFINKHFVPIKVDREQRPDIDEVYMDAVHALRGRGGWPMTVVMLPSGEPFFAGTYFPARTGDRGSRQGFLEILTELAAAWEGDRATLEEKGQQITLAVARSNRALPPGDVPGPDALTGAVASYRSAFDTDHGGFGRAPKFPRPSALEFLLRMGRRTEDPSVSGMATATLQHMAFGGIHDQIGGGFHRYSTDSRWLVPHFEKMLYDNAQLCNTYLAAWQQTGEPAHRGVVRKTLDYVAREMTHPGGAFYSATDADSMRPDGHREEGWFFTWTPAELRASLTEEESQLAEAVWGVRAAGNFEGRSILHRSGPADEDALHAMGAKLYAVRSERPPPLLDDKRITAWNGLMISAFARAGTALGHDTYTKAASDAAAAVLAERDERGRLRRVLGGAGPSPAVLDDYAFLIGGLLDLFEATADPRWLTEAVALFEVQEKWYQAPNGAFHRTASDGEELLTRTTPITDGAQPSGNSVTVHNALALARLTGDDAYRTTADNVLQAMSRVLASSSTSAPHLLSGLEARLDTQLEILVLGDQPGPMVDVLRTTYLPNASKLVLTPKQAEALAPQVPWLEGKTMLGGTTAFVCERGLCKRPTTEPKALASQLAEVSSL